MFQKILIANRGEIAVRILRTARRLGIRTVAIYSEPDAAALHVTAADESVALGGETPAESYLRCEAIIAAAHSTGATAIHPGYGFLSENAAFAEACARNKLTFIGPPVEAIRVMGSKSESKRVLAGTAVPIVPGYHGDDQSLERLQHEAALIGYPVLIKASAGGGGKGMRSVYDAATLSAAIAGARRESMAAFGDDRLLLEKLLPRSRHVEVQVFGDLHGQFVYLFDRDCSIQRRHQKVIEEAPAPGLSPDVNLRMGEAAVAVARAVHYVGAGTVEFLYQDGAFYFIEMNTRLQVEHPVTEMITGLDLVEWQLRIAAGEPLPRTQPQLIRRGHAFEARIYAEDPRREFLPQAGVLKHLRAPPESVHLRVDSGVRGGDRISLHYDPMIAKLIVWDETRELALGRLAAALREFEVGGVRTNVEFLAAIAAHPAYQSLDLDTGFIARHAETLLPGDAPADATVLALASLALLLRARTRARTLAARGPDPHSPWHRIDGWRLHEPHQYRQPLRDGELQRLVTIRFFADEFEITVAGHAAMRAQQATLDGPELQVALDGARRRAVVIEDGAAIELLCDGRSWRLWLDDPIAQAAHETVGSGRLKAPMPSAVVDVLVAPGDRVQRNQPLVVLEAMKMEHIVRSPGAGVVTAIHCAPREKVAEGADVITLELAPI